MYARDHAMDFDSLDGLLDQDIPSGSNHQCESLDPGEPPPITSGVYDPAIWPVERPRMDQSNMQQNVHPDLRNEVGDMSPATMEQLYVFRPSSQLALLSHSLQLPQISRLGSQTYATDRHHGIFS